MTLFSGTFYSFGFPMCRVSSRLTGWNMYFNDERIFVLVTGRELNISGYSF